MLIYCQRSLSILLAVLLILFSSIGSGTAHAEQLSEYQIVYGDPCTAVCWFDEKVGLNYPGHWDQVNEKLVCSREPVSREGQIKTNAAYVDCDLDRSFGFAAAILPTKDTDAGRIAVARFASAEKSGPSKGLSLETPVVSCGNPCVGLCGGIGINPSYSGQWGTLKSTGQMACAPAASLSYVNLSCGSTAAATCKLDCQVNGAFSIPANVLNSVYAQITDP